MAVSFSALSLRFFSFRYEHDRTHESLHLAWCNFAQTRQPLKAQAPTTKKNIKIKSQGRMLLRVLNAPENEEPRGTYVSAKTTNTIVGVVLVM